MPITRQAQIIQPIPPLPLSRRGKKQLWLSAILYLMACIWLGPTAAFWLTVIGAWSLFWLYLCSKWPFFGVFTVACISGSSAACSVIEAVTITDPTIAAGGDDSEFAEAFQLHWRWLDLPAKASAKGGRNSV